MQAGLILWEAELLALERDHQEVLSPKIKRAFLMNVLPASIQPRIIEHLDRLKTYKEVREKVVSLCHNIDDTDRGDIDDLHHPPTGSLSAPGEWDGWWQDDNSGWHEPEPAEELPQDIQGLADMKCHVCGGMGHLARNCPTPNPKGGGKGGKAGGGKGGKGGPKGGGKGGKGVRNSHLLCTTCGKPGHLKDRCWVTYPDLQRKKKVQGVAEQAEIPLGGIRIAMIETCGVCDTVGNFLPWAQINTGSFAQTTAACSNGNLSVAGGFVKPHVSNRS